MAESHTTADGWHKCIAATLTDQLACLDRMIFHYPLILETAGPARKAIAEMVHELEKHL